MSHEKIAGTWVEPGHQNGLILTPKSPLKMSLSWRHFDVPTLTMTRLSFLISGGDSGGNNYAGQSQLESTAEELKEFSFKMDEESGM